MRLILKFAVFAALSALAACGESPPPLEDVSVQDLRGAWRMINRSADCDVQYARFAQTGIFRVYSDKRAPKQYAAISRIGLEPGKITLNVTGMDNLGRVGISALVFSLVDEKLRLIDMKTPKGASFASQPSDLDADLQAYLKDMFRIEAERFAMNKCKAT